MYCTYRRKRVKVCHNPKGFVYMYNYRRKNLKKEEKEERKENLVGANAACSPRKSLTLMRTQKKGQETIFFLGRISHMY